MQKFGPNEMNGMKHKYLLQMESELLCSNPLVIRFFWARTFVKQNHK